METPLGGCSLRSEGLELVLEEQTLCRARVRSAHDETPGPIGIPEKAAAAVEDVPIEKTFLLSAGIRAKLPVVIDPAAFREQVVVALLEACDEACKEERGCGG